MIRRWTMRCRPVRNDADLIVKLHRMDSMRNIFHLECDECQLHRTVRLLMLFENEQYVDQLKSTRVDILRKVRRFLNRYCRYRPVLVKSKRKFEKTKNIFVFSMKILTDRKTNESSSALEREETN